MCSNESNPAATTTVVASEPQQWTPQTDAATPAQGMGQAPSAAAPLAASSGQQMVPGSDDAVVAKIRATNSQATFDSLMAGTHALCRDPKMAVMMLLCIICWTTQDLSQIDRIIRRCAVLPPWWDKPAEKNNKKSNLTNGAYYAQKVWLTHKIAVPNVYGYQPLAMYYPDENPRYGRDDIGISTLFCDLFRDSILRCIEQNCWYAYDGTRWVESTGKAMESCKAFTQALSSYYTAVAQLDWTAFPSDEHEQKKGMKNHPYIRYAESIKSRKVRETILKDAESVVGMSISQSEFDADGELFNCQNGTIDLNNCTLRPHSAVDHITKIANVAYIPGAHSQLWEQHIATVMEGDVAKAEFLQKAIGYSLRGSHDLECMMISRAFRSIVTRHLSTVR